MKPDGYRGERMKDIKIVFMGTPNFSVPVLEALIASYDVVGIVTQPDKLVGREQVVKYSPVKEVALQHQIRLFQPANIREDYESILELKPDIIITCAYGQIIPKELLEHPKHGCVNVHASLLPKLRGGDPIRRAIMEGHSKTGITVMQTVEKMDAGPILRMEQLEILSEDTFGSLYAKLSNLGRDVLMDVLPDIISGNIVPERQNHAEATYAYNLKKEEEEIKYEKTPKEIVNLVRGLNPFPGAYTTLETKHIKVWAARLGELGYIDRYEGEIVNIYEDGIGVKAHGGEVIFTEVQPAGKNRMRAKDFLNGYHNKDELIGKLFV